MRPAKFSIWLQQALLFIGRAPMIWIGYYVVISIFFVMGRIFPVLGIFSAVVFLFVGVGIAKYIDLKYSSEEPVAFCWAISKSLPLAIIAAIGVDLFWFVFSALANIISGEYSKIGLFFFNWELNLEILKHSTVHDIAGWLFSYANVALIFILLMLMLFASWFSYPLMLFNNYSWSEAKAQGDWFKARNRGAIYRMLAFIFVVALLCSAIVPLLTPFLYIVVSVLMYISYKDRQPKSRS